MEAKMSTFHLLNEMEIDEARSIIKRDCAQWLSEGVTVYRGLPERKNVGDRLLTKLNVRKDRRPMSSSKEVSAMLDDILQEKTGIKFRSQSVFCAKSKRVATGYGVPYEIFPIGQYDYCWSPYLEDAFFQIGRGEISVKFKREIKKVMDEEEMEPYEFMDIEEISQDPKAILTAIKLIPNFWKFNTDLKSVPDNHEIMIACDSYYAVATSIDVHESSF